VLVPGGDFQTLLERRDISATGGDPTRAGTVVVSAPEVDLSGGLVVLEGAFVDTAQLRDRCASWRASARAGSPASAGAGCCRRARMDRSPARIRAGSARLGSLSRRSRVSAT
jgi:hypothetical protein